MTTLLRVGSLTGQADGLLSIISINSTNLLQSFNDIIDNVLLGKKYIKKKYIDTHNITRHNIKGTYVYQAGHVL